MAERYKETFELTTSVVASSHCRYFVPSWVRAVVPSLDCLESRVPAPQKRIGCGIVLAKAKVIACSFYSKELKYFKCIKKRMIQFYKLKRSLA